MTEIKIRIPAGRFACRDFYYKIGSTSCVLLKISCGIYKAYVL